jgi:hypothetical protein
MERRIRLTWSSKHGRPWCPGTTRPTREPRLVPSGWTGFLKVQGLVDLIRQRAGWEARAASRVLDSVPSATTADPAERVGDPTVRG